MIGSETLERLRIFPTWDWLMNKIKAVLIEVREDANKESTRNVKGDRIGNKALPVADTEHPRDKGNTSQSKGKACVKGEI